MINIDVPYKEICKIEGLEDFPGYYIDINGNVYSTKRKNVGLLKMKPLYAGSKIRTYRIILCGKNGKQIRPYIHHLVIRAFVPKSDRRRYVVHRSDDRLDNSLANVTTIDKKSFRAGHNAGRPKKEIIEEMERGNLISENVANELKLLYTASLMKGLHITSEFDFINEMVMELTDEYCNRKGLKRIVHQLRIDSLTPSK